MEYGCLIIILITTTTTTKEQPIQPDSNNPDREEPPSPFANSAGDGHKSPLKKHAGRKKNSSNSKDNKKNSNDKGRRRRRNQDEGESEERKSDEFENYATSRSRGEHRRRTEQHNGRPKHFSRGYELGNKDIPRNLRNEKREKDDGEENEQLSTRGHTARATEKEELYKSIVDVDGNLLKPDVLEQFEANANKMKQLNKETLRTKETFGIRREEKRRRGRLGFGASHRTEITGASTASWQKSEIFEGSLGRGNGHRMKATRRTAHSLSGQGEERGNEEKNSDFAEAAAKKIVVNDDGKDIKVRPRSWSQEEDDLVKF